MKSFGLALVLLLAGSVLSFAQNKTVNTKASVVKWTGDKIGGSHYGEISIKSGQLEFSKNNITRGEVVIDMTSITNTDLEDQAYKQKLVDHLESDDFFGVKNFPTASFVITKASKFVNGKASVSGKITIKGKTEPISFDVVKKGNIYTAKVEIDRSKFDVRYGSNSFFDNLGDKAIDDIFVLDIKLVL